MHPDFGFLYALTNAAMPGHIKIGMTRRRPEERMAELSSATGVPVDFQLAYSRAFENSALAERMVHDRLESQGLRVSRGREFFEVSVTAAIAVIDEVAQVLAQESSRDFDRERFVRQAELLLEEDRPTTAQLERALSYLEYAAELGSPVERYRAGALAHDLANRRADTSSRGQAYRERAHLLFEQAGQEGVLRAHSRRAVMFLETGDVARSQVALTAYLSGMPADQMPDAELDYLVTSLREDWFPNRRVPNLLGQLNPWRAQIWAEARRRYEKTDPFLPWLQTNTHTPTELLIERAKLPTVGAVALLIMYLADPAAFYLLMVAGLAGAYLTWRWKRKRKASQRGKRRS